MFMTGLTTRANRPAAPCGLLLLQAERTIQKIRSYEILVTETTRRSPSKLPGMQADISSENSSIVARPCRSKSFSTESVKVAPSQLQTAFRCQLRLEKLAVMSSAPFSPRPEGTPWHWSTTRHQAMISSTPSSAISKSSSASKGQSDTAPSRISRSMHLLFRGRARVKIAC
jgi:hypothetical protein